MNRFGRRGLIFLGVLVPAALITVIAVGGVTAAPSRASTRWNHVAVARGTVSASEEGNEPQVKGPVWRVYHFTEVYGPKFTFVDVGRKGDSPGDYGVFRDPIFNGNGDRIGTIDVQCIAAYSDQCTGSIRLPGKGQISFSGITPLGKDPDHYPITGGTGNFAGVGGELKIEFPEFDSASLTLTLTR